MVEQATKGPSALDYDAWHCGACGDWPPRMVNRRTSAQLICESCGASSPVFSGEDAEDRARQAWRAMPPQLPDHQAQPGPCARLAPPRPTGPDGREVLELLAKMLVGGGYRVPVAGRSTVRNLGSSDIAGALGYMPRALERQVVTAVATRGEAQPVGRMARGAYSHIAAALRGMDRPPLDLALPADRWRLRLVIHDAALELVYPERRRPYGELAKAAKMRKDRYLVAFRVASSVFATALHHGRGEFVRRLFRDF